MNPQCPAGAQGWEKRHCGEEEFYGAGGYRFDWEAMNPQCPAGAHGWEKRHCGEEKEHS